MMKPFASSTAQRGVNTIAGCSIRNRNNLNQRVVRLNLKRNRFNNHFPSSSLLLLQQQQYVLLSTTSHHQYIQQLPTNRYNGLKAFALSSSPLPQPTISSTYTTTTRRNVCSSLSDTSAASTDLIDVTPQSHRTTNARNSRDWILKKKRTKDYAFVLQQHSFFSNYDTTTRRSLHDISSSSSSSSLILTKQLSKRDIANLEDYLWNEIGTNVNDPLLDKSIGHELQWLNRRIAISDNGTIQILLKLPSLLHPSLQKLKNLVKNNAEKTIRQWLIQNMKLKQQSEEDSGNHIESTTSNSNSMINVNVEAIATKPIPMMAKLVEDPSELLESIGPGLANISHFIAVYSCKGGVGKSTIAVNLAYEMSRMGGRIGLVDLDIYGPSLPVLVHPKDLTVRRSTLGISGDEEGTGKMIYPLEHENVKLLSLGFVSRNSGVPGSGEGNGASVMRGPMAGSVVSQLLKGTDWGELDVLILDLPPGTGDVQLQVLQDLQLSGAVAVTTPSKLAAVDTRKGIEMFTSLGVPTIAVVENMKYFQCEGGARHFPFGKGSLDLLPNEGNDRPNSPKIVELPISTATNDANDVGNPICLRRPDDAADELSAFRTLAENISGAILKMQFGRNIGENFVTFDSAAEDEMFDLATLNLSLDKSSGNEMFVIRLFGESGAIQKRIPPVQLRARDPKSGDVIEGGPFIDQLINSPPEERRVGDMVIVHKSNEKKSPSLSPQGVVKKGLYGYAVRWADGATIIYSNKCVAVATGGTIRKI